MENMPNTHPVQISVILPVRNGALTIASALGSILDQTFKEFEVIVLDDGSSDATGEVVSRMNDPRVRWISDGRQLGLAPRLNQGMELARGRYLARMDADDLSFPDRLQKQFDFLVSHPEIDLVGSRAVVFRNDGSVLGYLPFRDTHQAISAHPWRNLPLPHPTWMGRTDWFLRHRYRIPEVKRAEDQELLLRTYRVSKFACLDEPLLAYRQGEYRLRLTLLARRHILLAQLRVFLFHHEWTNVALAILSSGAKSLADIVVTLPGMAHIRKWTRVEVNAPSSLRDVISVMRAPEFVE